MPHPTQFHYSLFLWFAGITLLAAMIYLPLLGYLPLHLEEPRRALIAAEMLATGDYPVPMQEGQIY
jgi:4-amino-4-deoxy-L-arabinose transferase-like glycosyltransferase